MLMTIAKDFNFEAAHHLPNHDGECRRPHGHSYKVRVSVRGPVQGFMDEAGNGANPQEGMVVDFKELKQAYNKRVHLVLDHMNLNDNQALCKDGPPTAERIAAWIFNELWMEWCGPTTTLRDIDTRKSPHLYSVGVFETATSCAKVTVYDFFAA